MDGKSLNCTLSKVQIFSAAEWPHQEKRARDHIGVVDGEPGFVFVEVGVRQVEHVEAEDNYHPPHERGFR